MPRSKTIKQNFFLSSRSRTDLLLGMASSPEQAVILSPAALIWDTHSGVLHRGTTA